MTEIISFIWFMLYTQFPGMEENTLQANNGLACR
jgi:phage tail protein X